MEPLFIPSIEFDDLAEYVDQTRRKLKRLKYLEERREYYHAHRERYLEQGRARYQKHKAERAAAAAAAT